MRAVSEISVPSTRVKNNTQQEQLFCALLKREQKKRKEMGELPPQFFANKLMRHRPGADFTANLIDHR